MRQLSAAMVAMVVAAAACTTGSKDRAPTGPLMDVGPAPVDSAALLGYDLDMYNIARRVPGFAGIYRDRNHVPHIRLVDKSQENASAVAVASLLLSYHDAHANVQPVFESADFSALDLLAWRVTARELLRDMDVSGIGLDVVANRVFVGVATPSAEQRILASATALGIPQEALRLIPIGRGGPQSKVTDKVRPTTGGLKIVNLGRDHAGANFTGQCSLGFNVSRYGVAGLVTAAHCSLTFAHVDGTVLWQPAIIPLSGNQIATESYDPALIPPGGTPACSGAFPCRLSDAMFATAVSSATRGIDIAITTHVGIGLGSHGDSTISYRDPIVGFANAVPGDYLYKTGSRTGTTYGALYAPCMDRLSTYDQYPAFLTVTLLCQGIVAAGSAAGDSGSPVFDEAANNDATVYGIQWGGDGYYFFFSNIASIQQEIPGLAF